MKFSKLNGQIVVTSLIISSLFLPMKAFAKTSPVKGNVVVQKTSSDANNNIENINLKVENLEKPTLNVNKKAEIIEGNLFETNAEKIQEAFKIQKKNDIEDIKMLWESTVARNSVIKFALKKLAITPEQRKMHSSIMAKSVSTLISGASILPGVFGMDTVVSTASAASGKLANRVIANKSKNPKEMPLTDTELIQLAGLVEDLQNNIIKSYYDYKSSLDALKMSRQKLIIENRNYTEAMRDGNNLALIVSSAIYDKQLLEELKLKQKIKLYRLELERMAGAKTVANLNLIKIAELPVERSIVNVNSVSTNESTEDKEAGKNAKK